MIRDHLVRELRQRFPELAFVFDEPPGSVASLQSPCPALGRLDIRDDGDEATVYFTPTHGHFDCHDEALTIEQREKQIADDVMAFLDALFKDRVVVWQMFGGLAGGWRVLQPGEDVPAPSLARRQFLWTREIT
jgi:hypothetical protein